MHPQRKLFTIALDLLSHFKSCVIAAKFDTVERHFCHSHMRIFAYPRSLPLEISEFDCRFIAQSDIEKYLSTLFIPKPQLLYYPPKAFMSLKISCSHTLRFLEVLLRGVNTNPFLNEIIHFENVYNILYMFLFKSR